MVRLPAVLTYALDDTFFALFEESLLEKGQLKATLKTHRTPSNVQLLFSIAGEVELVCDRSLATFNYPIDIEREVNLKLGHENTEIDVNLYMIKQHTATLNVAQHLYDFISLAVPMKKLHPKFSSELEEQKFHVEDPCDGVFETYDS